MPQNPLRNIPSVNELLESAPLRNLVDKVSHNVVVGEVRSFLDAFRNDVQAAASEIKMPAATELAEKIADWIVTAQRPRLSPVINATGILLHTGLGRSPLPESALREIVSIAGGYASVEVDLESGERSQRVASVEKLLQELTGAEAAAVCNNNAGATLLTLAALADGKEVIVSRGHLVEIGGSYRLPDVMSTSGAKLHEVGTTNKTRISDYESAINDETAALMRVHTSNYVVAGFTEEASLAELVKLGRKTNKVVIDDIGSGALVDFSKYGLQGEPMIRDCVTNGADVVLFSGDKLLGGPQCGIVVGRQELVDKITKHPLMRALRVDKITLAALAATLRLYRDQNVAETSVPLLALLSASAENLKGRAERLAPQLQSARSIASAEPIDDITYLGGGSVPTQSIPTWCVALSPAEENVDSLAKRLRMGQNAVFGRIHQNRLLLDLRSVMPSQDVRIVEAIEALDSSDESEPGVNSSE